MSPLVLLIHVLLLQTMYPCHSHPLRLMNIAVRDSAENCDDPEERFIRVLQYYLAGWHIKPKGVKKPYASTPHTHVRLTPNPFLARGM